MRPELILWDWNGTLLDDVELCENALNRLLQRYGYPQRYDHEQYRAIFGFPVEDYYVPPQLCRASGKLHGGLHPGQRHLSADGRGR